MANTLYRGQTIHETWKGAPQAGLWMVYCKHDKSWITIGDPTPHAAAVEYVKHLRSDSNDMHCVPL